MSRLGLNFKRMIGQSNKTQPPALESCTLLMKTLHVSDESYSVTTTLTPKLGSTVWNSDKKRRS